MDNDTLLTGSLGFIGLADIFQILGGNSSNGVLRLTSQYVPHPGTIYFRNGDPINAAYGSEKGVKAIYALFGWTDGIFEFQQKDVTVTQSVKQSRMEIVLDALRMMDDGLIKSVGPPSFDEDALAQEAGSDEAKGLPVIKGPLLDYSYVLKEENFSSGSSIVSEGTHGKWMWVIYEGILKISRDTPNGEIDVARLGEGSFIGTLKSLLFGEYTRNASVSAETDVRLCLLDSESLYTEYTSLSPYFRNLLLSLDDRLRQINDRIVESYKSDNKFKDILKDKKVFLKQGSKQEDLFIILEGQAYVVAQTKNGIIPLLTLKKDDTFGNTQFLDFGHEPRSASVLATDDLKVDKIDIAGLEREYNKLSITFKNLIFHLTSCVSMATRHIRHLNKKN